MIFGVYVRSVRLQVISKGGHHRSERSEEELALDLLLVCLRFLRGFLVERERMMCSLDVLRRQQQKTAGGSYTTAMHECNFLDCR